MPICVYTYKDLNWASHGILYGSEIWTLKKQSRKSIDAFKLWSRRRVLKIPWTVKKTNQWNIGQINSEVSLETQMTRLKLSYFGHIRLRPRCLEKALMLGKVEGKRKRK